MQLRDSCENYNLIFVSKKHYYDNSGYIIVVPLFMSNLIYPKI